MAESVLADGCVSTGGGPEAALVGTDALAASHGTTAPAYGQLRWYTAPRHGRPSGVIMPPAASFGNPPFVTKARPLDRQPSIGAEDNFRRYNRLKEVVLPAGSVRNDALQTLAAEHLLHSQEALGGECTRRIGPNREIRVATSCTGSGGEVFTLLAAVDAFRAMNPDLRFKYVFHCEKHTTKRRFVQTLHKHLAGRLGQDQSP